MVWMYDMDGTMLGAVIVIPLVMCSLACSVLWLFSFDKCMAAQRSNEELRREGLAAGDAATPEPDALLSPTGQTVLAAILVIGAFGLLAFLPWQFGAIARGEESALPWVRFSQEYEQHGTMSALGSVAVNAIFLMWAFALPAHLAVKNYVNVMREWPFLPHVLYVLNALLGIVLCSPNNTLYKLIE